MSDAVKNFQNINVMTKEQAENFTIKGELSDSDIALISTSDLSKLPLATLKAISNTAMSLQTNSAIGNGNSPSGTGPAIAAPNAELNLGNLSDLSSVLGLLDNQTQAINNRVSLDLIKTNSSLRKENLNKRMDDLNKQIEKAKKEEKMSFWQKILGGISKALGFVTAAITITVGVMSSNPVLVGCGLFMLFAQIDQTVAEKNDGIGLTGMIAKGVFKASDDTAKQWNTWVDLGLTVAATLVSAFFCPPKLACNVKAIVNIINSSVSIGTNATNISNACVGLEKADIQSDILKLQAQMTRHHAQKIMIDQFQQALVEALKQSIESNQQLTDKVRNIVEGNRETTQEILTTTPANA